MKAELILKLLSLKREWKQKNLVLQSKSTKGYVSRIIRKLEDLNIIARIDRNNLVVVDLPKLLNHWISLRKFPKPYCIDVRESVEKVEDKLKKSNLGYSIAMFRAAWHRLKLLKIDKLEVYVLEKDLQKFFKLVGKPSPFGKVEVYTATEVDILGYDKVNGLKIVPLTQNYVDLMVVGGNGTKIALELAKKYELFGA